MKKVIDELLIEATILGMLDEASSYEDFGKNKIPGIGNKPITIHSALSYKSHDDFSQRSDKQKVYSDAIQNLQGGVESGAIKQNQVPDEYADEVKRKSPEPKQDDGATEKDPARDDQASGDTDISGTDSIVADDPPKKKKKAKSTTKAATEPKGDKELEKLRSRMFQERGQSSSWTGDEQSTPTGKPPSDARARQTALDTGFPRKGTKPWPKSEATGEPAAPAPGNAGSMMNEIFSVEGCNIAEEFYKQFGTTPTVDDIENILEQQFGSTKLAEENGAPDSADYRKKLRIAAEASVTKFERLKDGEANNAPPTDPPFGEMIRPPSEFYGASDSIEAQAAMIRELGDDAVIFGPDGPITEITDSPRTREELTSSLISIAKKHYKQNPKGPYAKFASGGTSNPNVDVDAIESEVGDMIENNNVKQFAEVLAYAGGGGANPSDTATFARSKEGNLMILFHSDKMETADQQANSTLANEVKKQEEYIEQMIESGELDEKGAKKARQIMGKFSERLKDAEQESDASGIATAAMALNKPAQKKKVVAILNAAAKSGSTKGEMKIDGKQVSAEEFLNHFSNSDNKPTKKQERLLQKIGDALKKDKSGTFSEREIDSLDASIIGAERTKKVVGAIQTRLKELDKIKTKDGNPLGQVVETKNIIDKLHLYAMNDPSELAYQSGMCATVIGRDKVNREVLREVFGVDNTSDLIGRVKVGNAAVPEGDYVDPDVGESPGVPNSLLQRSTTSFEKDEDGNTYYFTVDEEGNISGKTIDANDPNIKTSGKGKTSKPVPVGVVSGQKSLFYALDKDGEYRNFAGQAARSKSGAGGKLETAYVYGPYMRKGIEKFGDEETNESISYGYVQTMMLMEMASKV
jgi:hypothetical protein